MEPGITWYEVLGVLPDAAADRIRRRYEERAALLRGEMIAGAPSNVLVSVRRAQEFLDGAWEVLGDPATRERYDEAMGFRRRGGEAVTVHAWHPPAAGPGAQLGAR
jgi:curved DNA-binding protein CbpA